MYEPQRHENYKNICKQCSVFHSLFSQCLNSIICKQCVMLNNLANTYFYFIGYNSGF